MALSPGRAHSSMCHCSRLTSSGAAQLNTQPQLQVTDPAACPAHISCLASVARCSCMSLETTVDLLSERTRPIAPLPNVARKASPLAPARSIESRRCADAVMWHLDHRHCQGPRPPSREHLDRLCGRRRRGRALLHADDGNCPFGPNGRIAWSEIFARSTIKISKQHKHKYGPDGILRGVGHDDGPDAAATETDVAAAATMQPRVQLHPPPRPRRTPASASDSEAEGDQTGVTAGARTTAGRASCQFRSNGPPVGHQM